MSEGKKAFTDVLLVGYDNTSGDIPVLVISRKTPRGVDVIKVITDGATEFYEKLTGVDTHMV